MTCFHLRVLQSSCESTLVFKYNNLIENPYLRKLGIVFSHWKPWTQLAYIPYTNGFIWLIKANNQTKNILPTQAACYKCSFFLTELLGSGREIHHAGPLWVFPSCLLPPTSTAHAPVMVYDPPSTLKAAEVAQVLVKQAVSKHNDRYDKVFIKAVSWTSTSP